MGPLEARVAPEISLLRDLAIVTGTAALTAVVFKRLRLPLLFGFLTAGFLIGPRNPTFQLVRDEASLSTLADLGVVLLLFGLGLSFNFRQLRRVGAVAFLVTLVQGLLMFWLGYVLGQWIGWSRLDSIFLGAMLTISSTMISVQVLRDLGRQEAEASRIIFGVLVLQDIAAVLILVLLSGYAVTGGLALGDVGLALARMALFLLVTILIGLLLVPRLIDYIARHYGKEILVLTTLGLAFGYAILSQDFGFHVGLGAFLMGALVAEAKEYRQVEEHLGPVRDFFAALFFVSIGTLVDLEMLATFWKPVVALCALVLVGKFASGALAAFIYGHPPAVAFAVGAGLAQIGEFSLIIAGLGQLANVTSDFLFPIVAGVSAVTSLLATLLLRQEVPLLAWLGRVAPTPLRTYAHLYTSWMGAVHTRASPARLARRVHARRGAVVGGIVLGTALGGAWTFQRIALGWLSEKGFRPPLNALVYWGLALAVLIPILFRFFQAVNRWLETWEPAEAQTGGLRRTHVVRYTFYLLGAVLLGLPVISIGAPFLQAPFVAVAWIVMVASAAFLLWTGIARLHTRIESNVQAILDDEHIPAEAPRVVRDLMTSDFPWNLGVETVELRTGAWAAGKTIGETNLRSATGASVVLVERGDRRDVTPSPDSVLLPSDRLTLIGNPEQLSSARAVLTRPTPAGTHAPELRLGRLYVAQGSPLDGVRLADAALPSRSGLQVVAILREAHTIANPGASETFRAGDIVIVLGLQEQITAATQLASPSRSPDQPAAAPA